MNTNALISDVHQQLNALWYKVPRRTRNRMINQPTGYRSIDKWRTQVYIKGKLTSPDDEIYVTLRAWEPPTRSFDTHTK